MVEDALQTSDEGGGNFFTYQNGIRNDFWTIFVPDPQGGGGGLFVDYTTNAQGNVTAQVRVAGSNGGYMYAMMFNRTAVYSASDEKKGFDPWYSQAWDAYSGKWKDMYNSLEYSDALDKTLSVVGNVAGAFESGAVVSAAQIANTGKAVSITKYAAFARIGRSLGSAGIGLTLAVAVHEGLTGHDNTHTLVDLGVTALGAGAFIAFGTVALPAVAVGGLVYGIWSFSGGSDWIDEKWGYRDPVTFKLK